MADTTVAGIPLNANTALGALRWTVNSVVIPAIIIFVLAKAGRFGTSATAAWMFGVFVGAGALGIAVSLILKGTASAGASLAALALMLPLISQFKLPDLVGAYMIAGGAVAALTLVGQLEKVSDAIPSEIVMAMLAGVLLKQEARLIPMLVRDPWVIGATLAAYFGAKRLTKGQLQSLVLAVIVGIAVAMFMDTPKTFKVPFVLTQPKMLPYRFSLHTSLSLALPLTLAILGVLNPTHGGWKTPERVTGIGNGVANLGIGLFGAIGVSISKTAPGEKDMVKTVLEGGALIGAGCLGITMVVVLRQLPLNLLQALALLALLPLLLQSLYLAIAKGNCKLGALAAIMVTLSGVQWYGIGPLFWAIVAGAVVAWLADRA